MVLPKRALEQDADGDAASKRQAIVNVLQSASQLTPAAGGGMAGAGDIFTGTVMKLLLTQTEATVVRGFNGATMAVISKTTGTDMQLSPDFKKVYPGTTLLELDIRGATDTDVLLAANQVFAKITEKVGYVASCDARDLQPGESRVKMLLPSKVAWAFLEQQGAVIKQLRDETGVHAVIETQPIPPNSPMEACEQVISLEGFLSGIQLALQHIESSLGMSASEPWFTSWAATCHCGMKVSPDIVLFQQDHMRAKGESKGSLGQPLDAGILVLKLLLWDFEGSSVLGAGGIRTQEISAATGSKISLSGRNEFYPGTQLQELRIWGQTQEPVLNAAQLCLQNIAVAGMPVENIPDGGPGPQCEVRLKILVPMAVLKKLMDSGGQLARQMKDQSNINYRIGEEGVPATVACHEQVMNLTGPLVGAQVALEFMVNLFATMIDEPWFAGWSAKSQVATVAGGGGGGPESALALMGKGKGPPQPQGLMGLQHKSLAMEPSLQQSVAQGPSLMQTLATGMALVQAPEDAEQAQAQTQQMQAQLEAQAKAEAEAKANDTGMMGLMGLLTERKGYGKGMSEKGKKGMQIQMELLLEMELAMEKELVQDFEGMGKGGKVRAMMMKGKGKGQPAGPPTVELPSARGTPMGIKFLADPAEMQCIQLVDIGFVQLQLQAKARIVVSDHVFPGTIGLQEVRVLAESAKALFAAVIIVLAKIHEVAGKLASGEQNVEPGHARIKMLVPTLAAAAIQGPGGKHVKQLNEICGVKTHVDMNSIPCTTEMAEQAVCLVGSMQAVCAALPTILGHIAPLANETWFRDWITTSNAGRDIPGLMLWCIKQQPKGKGEGAIISTITGQPLVAAYGDEAAAAANAPAMSPPPLGPEQHQSHMQALLAQQAQELLAKQLAGAGQAQEYGLSQGQEYANWNSSW